MVPSQRVETDPKSEMLLKEEQKEGFKAANFSLEWINSLKNSNIHIQFLRQNYFHKSKVKFM